MRARFTVISFHLKHIMVGDHISNVLKYCDAVPGIVVRDEPKEEIENSIAELPIADLHFLACPATAGQALRQSTLPSVASQRPHYPMSSSTGEHQGHCMMLTWATASCKVDANWCTLLA